MNRTVWLQSVFSALVIILVASVIVVKGQTQPVMTCGGTGVIIRGDSTILIDGWKTVEFSPSPTSNRLPPLPISDHPSKITIGKNVLNTAKICFETDNGMNCISMDVLRKLR